MASHKLAGRRYECNVPKGIPFGKAISKPSVLLSVGRFATLGVTAYPLTKSRIRYILSSTMRAISSSVSTIGLVFMLLPRLFATMRGISSTEMP